MLLRTRRKIRILGSEKAKKFEKTMVRDSDAQPVKIEENPTRVRITTIPKSNPTHNTV